MRVDVLSFVRAHASCAQVGGHPACQSCPPSVNALHCPDMQPRGHSSPPWWSSSFQELPTK